MFRVYVGNDVDRWAVNVQPNTTLRAILDQEQVDYSRGSVHLDGSTLNPGDLDKTFAEIGVTGQCYLLVMQKLNNANA